MLFHLYLIFILLFFDNDVSVGAATNANITFNTNAMICEESSVRIMEDDNYRIDMHLWHVWK